MSKKTPSNTFKRKEVDFNKIGNRTWNLISSPELTEPKAPDESAMREARKSQTKKLKLEQSKSQE
jgi:hypothetical protein